MHPRMHASMHTFLAPSSTVFARLTWDASYIQNNTMQYNKTQYRRYYPDTDTDTMPIPSHVIRNFATLYDTIRYEAIPRPIYRHNTDTMPVPYHTIQHNTVPYHTVQYGVTQRNALQCLPPHTALPVQPFCSVAQQWTFLAWHSAASGLEFKVLAAAQAKESARSASNSTRPSHQSNHRFQRALGNFGHPGSVLILLAA